MEGSPENKVVNFEQVKNSRYEKEKNNIKNLIESCCDANNYHYDIVWHKPNTDNQFVFELIPNSENKTENYTPEIAKIIAFVQQYLGEQGYTGRVTQNTPGENLVVIFKHTTNHSQLG